MIEETGQILKVQGDAAQVETERASTCASCAVNAGCGSGVLSRVLGKRPNRVWAINSAQAKVGDRVVLGLREQALVRGSLAVYGIPLIGLLAGGLMGDYFGETELASIVFAVFGFLGGLFWLRGFGRRISNDVAYQAQVLRRIDGPPVTLST